MKETRERRRECKMSDREKKEDGNGRRAREGRKETGVEEERGREERIWEWKKGKRGKK